MAEHTDEVMGSFYREFGHLLARRFADYLLAPPNSPIDRATLGLARYLRAARTNAGLSQSQLAARAGITKAEVVALEHGLILLPKIEIESLQAVAEVLGEDFEFILGYVRKPDRIGV